MKNKVDPQYLNQMSKWMALNANAAHKAVKDFAKEKKALTELVQAQRLSEEACESRLWRLACEIETLATSLRADAIEIREALEGGHQ
jgi:hypothetical protein